MSCHGRETGLGSKTGVRKQKGMSGRKEGTGSHQINGKEKGKKEQMKRDVQKGRLQEGEIAEEMGR